MRCQLGMLCVSVLLVSTGHAAIYKWTDEHGQVHFGDRPPAESGAQSVRVRKSGASSAASEEAGSRLDKQREAIEELTGQREARAEKTAEREQQRQKRKKSCTQLKARIDHSESINRYYRYDDEGKVVYLSDQEGDALRKSLRDRYSRECG